MAVLKPAKLAGIESHLSVLRGILPHQIHKAIEQITLHVAQLLLTVDGVGIDVPQVVKEDLHLLAQYLPAEKMLFVGQLFAETLEIGHTKSYIFLRQRKDRMCLDIHITFSCPHRLRIVLNEEDSRYEQKVRIEIR